MKCALADALPLFYAIWRNRRRTNPMDSSTETADINKLDYFMLSNEKKSRQ